MTRTMVASRRGDLDTVLVGIEHAATEALASMQHTVGVLPETESGLEGRRRVGDLRPVKDLVRNFTSPSRKATPYPDTAVPDDVPHEVRVAVFRVVEVAVTNVHAARSECHRGHRAVGYDDRVLEVTVSDDGGRGYTRLPVAACGGGFGLVGPTERFSASSGQLKTGPRPGRG
ncbi:hypothetical protein AB0D11_35590 [Streptomyces monashensis]|uniref:hypothetical protein n=1 Tax=Streptomyces monashensis TaxID=1678012 RepID=UPI0033FC211F